MKLQDRYLMFVRWSEEDSLYIGYCPDLFPWGGACHAATPVEAFKELWEIVEETITQAQSQNIELPPPTTRPMREVETAA
jgi:predicted RNase H-like HicB family nuclease